jgi:protoporphyrin/coproporphyrin ferrochelatase
MANMKKGLLLLNLGTPDSPEPEAVGRYLREFLMDGRVVDIPWPIRWFLVNCIIVPRRKFASSELYKTIWGERGSPLLFHLEDFAAQVKRRLGDNRHVEIAMRYGNPSVAKALESFRQAGVDEVLVAPLYPQYAESTTLSSVEECNRVAKLVGLNARLEFLQPFFVHPSFIDPSAQKVKEVVDQNKTEHVVFSFHGLPERHVRRTDRSNGQHCLVKADCCSEIVEANRDCYRAQCVATAKAIAIRSGLAPEEYTVCFQSRLGRAVWIGPSTEDTIVRLAKEGKKKIAVACPSFVSDCLETIEEIGGRGAELFHEYGGELLVRVDCLNSDAAWVDGFISLCP